MSRQYLLRTLGCKVNQYESQQLREILESCGLRQARPGQPADLAVVNTCGVTATASAKTRQAVRRASAGGTVPVIVVGCGATADAERLGSIPGVVAVWAHQDGVTHQLRNWLAHWLNSASDQGGAQHGAAAASAATCLRTGGDDEWMSSGVPAQGEQVAGATDSKPLIHISVAPSPPDVNVESADGPTISRFDGRQRAFLKVQDGCDACCTYCVIPRLRPKLHFKPIEVAVAEAGALVRAGHGEIVLTGIYLGAYGRPTALRRRFDNGQRSPLAELVEALAGVEGLMRLRLSSLEPGDPDDRLLEVLASHDCCVPHLHLPLQSGSPRILKRMNRQYRADDYRAMIDRVQAALDRPAISTDVVVGFPGETDEDFDETLAVVREAGFCKIHAFPFSPRPGTAAARWTELFVDGNVVRQRMKRLRELGRESARRFGEQFVGSIERVLVERLAADEGADGDSLCHGHSDRYFEVHFSVPPGRPLGPGGLARVRIDRVGRRRIHGTLVSDPSGPQAP